MRVFIAVLVLIFSFQSWTKSEGITEFEIEGISIGDSLLDYFSEEEILIGLGKPYRNTDEKFYDVNLKANWFNTYSGLQLTLKKDDKKYILHSIDGNIFFQRDDKSCIEKMNEIIDKLTVMFKDSKIAKQKVSKHPADPTGRSTTRGTAYFLEDGTISARCYLWVDPMELSNYVAVSARTNEFNEWLISYSDR